MEVYSWGSNSVALSIATYSPTLIANHRLKMMENKLVRKIHKNIMEKNTEGGAS
jgi:hypothetical protein